MHFFPPSVHSIKTAAVDSLRRSHWWFRALLGNDVYFRPQIACDLAHVGGRPGTNYGAWVLSPTYLTSQSVVYSLGIGDDISFDLDLIRRFGMQIHAFDPTPASHRWLQTQNIPDRFIPHTYGLAHYDGTATFYAPTDPTWISHSLLATKHTQDVALEVPVRRLATLMDEFGHDHIDLLKMDIEGAEYEAIEDILASGLNVHQILVEFHHRFDAVSPAQTAHAISRLNDAGYHVAYVSTRGEEYTFVRL